ncbi:MAG: 4-hydroxy-3-methylbut-2-enyl diphosphate reductase [Spirochaetaceae bacterium]|jgi:4-hydroxy-3-methylbut-2-enyl diphosphate reductase|nr:4-hydroxy-3-methylbut-2-enyl diphosphate reductase [Spirochaetaceae bacterium]
MKVIKAKVLGYCMGVRRAVEMALKVRTGAEGAVYTYGPLIHNRIVLDDLERRGIFVLDEGGGIDAGAKVIIRAHGVAPQKEAELKAQGAEIFDATCPKVKKNQLTARELSASGWTVFLAGEKNHGEIAGILGYAPFCIVVENAGDAEEAARSLFSMQTKNNASFRTALLGQTTMSAGEYRNIAAVIGHYFPDVRVEDTVCAATQARQDALTELCAGVDAILVAGDSRSANTRRLLSMARELRPAWLVEDAASIPPEIFTYGVVGISAGASAPDILIDDLEKALGVV